MDFDIIIIGAGVVGLAVCNSLKDLTEKICIIEKNHSFGMETSSRNSEVIHSGIYYPKNSLKSKLCIEGNKRLYKYLDRNNIPYNKCGKLIIAKNDYETSKLLRLKEDAYHLNIKCKFLDRDQLMSIEPLVNAKNALHIESTGVIDSHAYMASLSRKINDVDISIAYKTEVVDIIKLPNGYEIKIKNPDESYARVTTRLLVNCSGLNASSISSLVGINDDQYVTHYWKGSYFWVNNKIVDNINSLIYPVPNDHLSGLGIHTTIGMDGRVKLGPDAEYLGNSFNLDYSIDEKKKQHFWESCRQYLPFLELNDLEQDFSGIRPKLQRPGDDVRDFIIKNETTRGFDNFINLLGIESPGLTASLSIGEYVKQLIRMKI